MSEARRHPSTIFGYSDVMASRSHLRANRAAPRRRRRRRIRLATVRRFARSRGRACRAFMRAVLASPPTVRAVVISVLILLLWLGVNWTYHAYSKPTEILFPFAHSFDKHPAETWNEYGSLFRKHATEVITPELLAALAQVEGGGNPVARTYWRWRLTSKSLGAVPTGIKRGRHVPDHRRDVPRGEALLHPRPRGDPGWPLARREIVLVQQSLQPCRAEPCDRVDRGPARPKRRERADTPTARPCDIQAKAGSGRRDPSLWSCSGQRLCSTRLPTHPQPAMRRPRRQPLPRTGQWNETPFRPACLRRLAVPAHQIFSAESGVAMDSSDRPSALTPNHSSTIAPASIIPAPTR